MTKEGRAFVAWVSGQLADCCKVSAISETAEGELFNFELEEQCVKPTLPERPCNVSRDAAAANYCLLDPKNQKHICLSLYDRLFEGFDHGSASHFNGFIDGPNITLYDFAASDYFSYSLQPQQSK